MSSSSKRKRMDTSTNAPNSTAEATINDSAEKLNWNANTSASSLSNNYASSPIEDVYLNTVIMPFVKGVCSNKSLKNLLNIIGIKSWITHLMIIDSLSNLPNARNVFLRQLNSCAKHVAVTLLEETQNLLAICNHKIQGDIHKITLNVWTPNDSSQAKLLRLLKTIDYLYSKKKRVVEGVEIDEEIKDGIFAKDAFKKLWEGINEILETVEKQTNLEFVAHVLLPIIECFLIVSKYHLVKKDAMKSSNGNLDLFKSPNKTGTLVSAPLVKSLSSIGHHSHPTVHQDEQQFFLFTEHHKKILNTLIRNSPKLLRGSFALLIHNPKVLDFDNKRHYFQQNLHRKPPGVSSSTIHVNIRRNYIFQDSYYQLQNRTGEELKYGKLSVKFAGEEAADYGGVTREWFQELTKEIFNPNYALFIASAEKGGVTYQPNSMSTINPSHLMYFKFVGRVIGKAVYDSKLLDCYFTRSVYKHILGLPVEISDMEAVDPDYYKSQKWILDNPINDVLDLTFSLEVEEFGQKKIIDLIENGRSIAVTDENKSEYVRLVCETKLTTAIKDQIKAFLDGFHEIIPRDLVRIFNEKELELLISGVPDIDIDDWKNQTEYRGYTSVSGPVQWFWRAVRSFNQEERAKLLQFATGTSKVPLEGFAKLYGISGIQKFQIHKDYSKVKGRLPSAHTCFNQVDLPEYESFEELKERLLTAITEASTGFGFE